MSSSRQWQLDSAADLIDDSGEIVAEFFDVGWSRKVPWSVRPEACRLVAMVAEPGRRFDAVVVGEYERAFEGGQLRALLPVLRRHGVELWLPEFGGAVDEADPVHQAALLLLGCQSRREVLRARFRTTAAMRAQARDQGRHLGGRPPVRLPARGCRRASEPGACPLGTAAAPAGSGDSAARTVDFRSAIGWREYGGDRAGAQRARGPAAVGT
jgi:hypothetical protein